MSSIHKCLDGTQERTGRNTPIGYVACQNNGGEVTMASDEKPLPLTPKKASYMGISKIGWVAIVGVLGYVAYTKGIFKK